MVLILEGPVELCRMLSFLVYLLTGDTVLVTFFSKHGQGGTIEINELKIIRIFRRKTNFVYVCVWLCL